MWPHTLDQGHTSQLAVQPCTHAPLLLRHALRAALHREYQQLYGVQAQLLGLHTQALTNCSSMVIGIRMHA